MSGSKRARIAGFVLSVLVALLLAGPSAISKLTQWEGKAENFAKLGWTEDVMFKIGIVEVAIALLFMIPRTAFIGAILISAYLGGAVATHVRVGDAFVAPIIIGIVVWVALGLRNPDIFRLAFGIGKQEPSGTKP
jgi:hypothetical protein